MVTRRWPGGEATKRTVLAGAAALVQLSKQESLSLVVLEAWAVGTPVIVARDCAVLAGQVRRLAGVRRSMTTVSLPTRLTTWPRRVQAGANLVSAAGPMLTNIMRPKASLPPESRKRLVNLSAPLGVQTPLVAWHALPKARWHGGGTVLAAWWKRFSTGGQGPTGRNLRFCRFEIKPQSSSAHERRWSRSASAILGLMPSARCASWITLFSAGRFRVPHKTELPGLLPPGADTNHGCTRGCTRANRRLSDALLDQPGRRQLRGRCSGSRRFIGQQRRRGRMWAPFLEDYRGSTRGGGTSPLPTG